MSLIDQLTKYGADIEGIQTRFAGDEELYAKCFELLLSDTNFQTLGDNIAEADYHAAFKSAHALKGVIGNMGLTPLYNMVSDFVEDLRSEAAGDADAVSAAYLSIMKEYDLLQNMAQQA